MRSFLKRVFPAMLLAALLGGCAGYAPLEQSAGPTAVHLAPIINEADVPQVIAPLSRNLRERINHSPNWRLAGEDEAGVILRVTITRFDRDAVSRDPADTGRPLSFHETLGATLEWESDSPAPWGPDNRTRVEADTTAYGQPGLNNTETIIVARLADDLAGKLIDRLNWPATMAD